ncbi:hypothetical protein BGZ52_007887 [Haplosporangium bisporale]|nr:hypothetical protein BGZ52_007887 [Haplosporangium bisporale]
MTTRTDPFTETPTLQQEAHERKRRHDAAKMQQEAQIEFLKKKIEQLYNQLQETNILCRSLLQQTPQQHHDPYNYIGIDDNGIDDDDYILEHPEEQHVIPPSCECCSNHDELNYDPYRFTYSDDDMAEPDDDEDDQDEPDEITTLSDLSTNIAPESALELGTPPEQQDDPEVNTVPDQADHDKIKPDNDPVFERNYYGTETPSRSKIDQRTTMEPDEDHPQESQPECTADIYLGADDRKYPLMSDLDPETKECEHPAEYDPDPGAKHSAVPAADQDQHCNERDPECKDNPKATDSPKIEVQQPQIDIQEAELESIFKKMLIKSPAPVDEPASSSSDDPTPDAIPEPDPGDPDQSASCTTSLEMIMSANKEGEPPD